MWSRRTRPASGFRKKPAFLEKPFENFNHLQNEGRIMLECELPLPFTVIPATADEACFVFGLYAQNRTALARRQHNAFGMAGIARLRRCGRSAFSHLQRGDAGRLYEAQRAVEYGHGLPFYAVRRKAASARRNRPFCRSDTRNASLPRADLLRLAYKRPPTTSPRKPCTKPAAIPTCRVPKLNGRRFVKRLNEAVQTPTP